MTESADREHVVVDLLGQRTHVLDLSREIGPDIPIYPGHAKVAFWWHLTHDEVKHYRIHPESRFGGYGVKGMTLCDHISTHIDAVYHFNRGRPDLTVDRLGLEALITRGAWIDLSAVPPRTHITLSHVRRALEAAGVTLEPGMTLLCYTGASAHWRDPIRFNSDYPGFDEEASRWLLDQGLANLCTDAPSTDNPADNRYPNHLVHGERCVPHTEIVANINRISMHAGFYVMILPLKLVGLTGSPVRALALWTDGATGDDGPASVDVGKLAARPLQGLLLKESLEDDGPLDLIRIVRTTLSRIDSAAPSQPRWWTEIRFQVDADRADTILQRFGAVLRPSWYLHCWTDSHIWVVFRGRVFKYPRGSQAMRGEAVAYGLSVGVPRHQLDWEQSLE